MKCALSLSLIVVVFVYLDENNLASSRHLTSSDLIRCPLIHPNRGFDKNRFSGKWYQSWIITLPDGSPPPQCATEIITALPAGLMNVYTKVSDVDGRVFYRNGKLVPGKSPSEFTLLYPGDQFKHEYQIISTNYDDFAIVYSCNRIDDSLTVETGQILTRRQAVTDELVAIISGELKKYRLYLDRFTGIDQVSCFNMTR